MHQAIVLLTVFFSVLAKMAICHQAWVNWRRGACAGMSIPFFLLGMVSYDMWTLDGLTGGGWGLIWGQGPGAALCLLVVWQVCWYRWAGRLGWHRDKNGHYPGMRECRICIDGFPLPCTDCGGLMHGTIKRAEFSTSTPLVARYCDRCTRKSCLSSLQDDFSFSDK